MRLLHNYTQLDLPSGLFHIDNRCWQESFEISWHIGRQNCDVSILGAYIEESIYSTLKDLSHKLLIYILIHTLHKIHSGRRIYFVCIYRIYTCLLAPPTVVDTYRFAVQNIGAKCFVDSTQDYLVLHQSIKVTYTHTVRYTSLDAVHTL